MKDMSLHSEKQISGQSVLTHPFFCHVKKDITDVVSVSGSFIVRGMCFILIIRFKMDE